MLMDRKSPLLSWGVLGGSSAAMASIWQIVSILQEQGPSLIAAGTALFTALIGVYGRIRATKKNRIVMAKKKKGGKKGC